MSGDKSWRDCDCSDCFLVRVTYALQVGVNCRDMKVKDLERALLIITQALTMERIVTIPEKDTTREANWRELFKRYLFLIIQEESTIFDDAIERSTLFSDSHLTAIRKLADEAEDEYES